MRRGFTLIEILVSISLLSLVLMGLYESLDIQRSSNKHLFNYLQKSVAQDKAVTVLFNDLIKSDGNLTLKKGEFDRLCIGSTKNSLYALPVAKVCWVVSKEKNSLVRIEGGEFSLPVKNEDRVEVDKVISNVKIFDITYNKKLGKVLVVLDSASTQKPYIFMVRGIYPPPKPKKKLDKNRRMKLGKPQNEKR